MGCVTKVVVVIVRKKGESCDGDELCCFGVQGRVVILSSGNGSESDRVGYDFWYPFASQRNLKPPFVLPMIIDVTLLGFRPEEVKRDS